MKDLVEWSLVCWEVSTPLLFSHLSTFVPIPARNKYAFVFVSFFLPISVDELLKWGVTLHKHVGAQGDIESFTQLLNTFGFGFSAAIGEQNERDGFGL